MQPGQLVPAPDAAPEGEADVLPEVARGVAAPPAGRRAGQAAGPVPGVPVPPGASVIAPGPLPERAEELATLLRLTDRLYRAADLEQSYEAALDAITTALGCRRASVLLFDDAGVMRCVAARGLSDAYLAAVAGHAPWPPGHPDPGPVFVPDIDLTAEPDAIKAAVRAEDIRALGFIPIVARGGTIGKFMAYHAGPHNFTPAEREIAVHIARQLGFALDRARSDEARRLAEGALRETEDRFRLMSEHAPVMIWVSRPDGSCLHLNRMLREFWGVGEDTIASFDWSTTIHPEDAARVREEMVLAIAERRPATVDARYRNANGEWRVLATHARPRFAADATFLGMIGVNTDTTEQKVAEAQRELLLAELNHRVKNMLAVVQGIARQTFRKAGSVEDARQSFDGRLMALATAHDLLTCSTWESASLAQLARDALPIREERPQISVAGPDVRLDARQTLGITLALHELYTNAIKYGALSTEAGRVALDWRVVTAPAPRLCLSWRETGGPAGTVPPAREGFGSRLIRQVFTHDLGGEASMEFGPDGLVCAAEIPLA